VAVQQVEDRRQRERAALGTGCVLDLGVAGVFLVDRDDTVTKMWEHVGGRLVHHEEAAGVDTDTEAVVVDPVEHAPHVCRRGEDGVEVVVMDRRVGVDRHVHAERLGEATERLGYLVGGRRVVHRHVVGAERSANATCSRASPGRLRSTTP
jgi:hypothetical protein